MTNQQQYEIRWSTSNGYIGWTTLNDCEDIDDAIAYWMNHIVGSLEVPIDATLDQIKCI
jgi:hypothetical protein